MHGGEPVAGKRMKIGDFCGGESTLLRLPDDSPGEGMLTFDFERIGGGQKLRFRNTFGRPQLRHLRFAPGEGAGLIQRHKLHLAGLL